MAQAQYGIDGKLYYGAAGSTASTEFSNVRDITLNGTVDEADSTTRAGGGWKSTEPVLRDAELQVTGNYINGDTTMQAIEAAWAAGTAVALACKDQATGRGLDADCSITAFNRTENAAGVMEYSFTAKPRYITRAPEWLTGTGS